MNTHFFNEAKPHIVRIWLEYGHEVWSMHGWVDQFGCHANQLCLVVAIAMPMLL